MGVDIGAIVEGGTGIGQIVSGMLIQQETGDKIKDWQKNYPEYSIPGSIQSQVDLLRKRANQGFAEQDLMQGQIQQNTAQGISASRQASTSAADLLGATTSLYGSQTQAMTDLQIASARQRAANQLDYAQGLGVKAQYEDKAFTWNEGIPWQTEMNRLMGIQQSAYDSITGGIENLAASGADYGV